MRLAVGAGLVAVAAAPAHADSNLMHLADLLTQSRLEIIHVAALRGTTIDGTVVMALRSDHKVGAAIRLDLGGVVHPAVGDEVLVACDELACPRAAGIDTGGAFILHASPDVDNDSVRPTLVARAAIARLAAGKPAPALCIEGTIALDDDKATPPFRISVDAASGEGEGVVDGIAVSAQLDGGSFHSGLSIGLDAVVACAPDKRGPACDIDRDEAQFVTTRVSRGRGGCFVATLSPSDPVARTRVSLGSAIHRRVVAAATFATGTLDVAAGLPVPSGPHRFVWAINAHGRLAVTSDLIGGVVDAGASVAHGHTTLALDTPVLETTARIEVELPMLLPEDLAMPAGVAAILSRAPETPVEVFWAVEDTRTALGTLRLRYVRER